MNKNKVKFGSQLNVSTQEFGVSAYQRTSMVYNIFLQDVIQSAEDFQSAIMAFQMAQEDDVVIVHLSSDGGSCDASQTFISAMRNCRGNVHLQASGTIASMAAFILIACDSFELDEFASIMIHSASFGSGGPVQDVVEYTQFVKKQTDALLRHYTAGFLTKEEIHDVLFNKREIWLNAREFCERYERRMKCLSLVEDYISDEGIDENTLSSEIIVKYIQEIAEPALEALESNLDDTLSECSNEELETIVGALEGAPKASKKPVVKPAENPVAKAVRKRRVKEE